MLALRRRQTRAGAGLFAAFVVAAPPVRAETPMEVDVLGSSITPLSKDPFAAGSVITADRLGSPGAQSGDVLRGQPGINVIDSGGYGSFSTACIRGATAAQTPVYLAGVRINDDVGGAADLSLVPVWLLHRVEIYRSNAPLEADQLGIGGAIFFEPRRPSGPEVSMGTLAGSWGTRGAFGHVALGNPASGAVVGVRYDTAQNNYPYLNDQGMHFTSSTPESVPRSNADVNTLNVWGYGTQALAARGRVDVVTNVVSRTGGLPGLALYPSRAARGEISRELVAVRAKLGCGTPGCEISTTTSLLLSNGSFADPHREVGLNTTHLDVAASRVEEGVLATWSVTPKLGLVPQAHVAVERLSLTPKDQASVNAERISSRAAFAAEWQPLDLLGLRAMASVECNTTLANGKVPWALSGDESGAASRNDACAEVDPAARVGVRVGNEAVAGLVNVGRYVRVPTLAERYGVSGLVRGNPTLKPEQGITVDLGVRAASRDQGASVDAFGFLRQSTDLIAYERSSFQDVRPYNVGSARTLGAEVMASYRPFSFLRAEASLTLLDARDVRSNRQTVNDVLPYLPRLVLGPRIEVLIPKPSRAGSTDTLARLLGPSKVSATYFYESTRFVDPAGLVVLPEQGSLEVEAETLLARDHITLRGRLVNLLDQTRTDLVGYPLPGRSFYVSLEARW